MVIDQGADYLGSAEARVKFLELVKLARVQVQSMLGDRTIFLAFHFDGTLSIQSCDGTEGDCTILNDSKSGSLCAVRKAYNFARTFTGSPSHWRAIPCWLPSASYHKLSETLGMGLTAQPQPGARPAAS